MGPLAGVRAVEMAGIGPAPFCAMLLADMGAEVVRVDRRDAKEGRTTLPVLNRGRRSVALDVKNPLGCAALLRLVARADVLIEGFRPGVMERLGLGPDTCLSTNPRLVYARVTGFGREGPLAGAPGHDINYIALTGALAAIGGRDRPVPPLNLVGDFGGGALFLAFGIVSALLETSRSGHGQVVDAAMVDGAAALMTPIYGLAAERSWRNARSSNFLDGAAPFYGVYECADGKWIAVGAIEDRFYRALLDALEIRDSAFEAQWDEALWPMRRAELARLFRTRTRAHWCARLEGTDACVTPVLDLAEAPLHPQMAARGTFAELNGVPQPRPAPRFSRTDGELSRPPCRPGEHTIEVLRDWGFGPDDLAALQRAGAI